MIRLSPAGALSAYLIAAFLATMQWTTLPLLGAWIVVLAALVVALDRRPDWFTPAGAAPIGIDRASLLPANLTLRSVVLGGLLCVPTWLHLVATWRQEYGFQGDDPYHFSAARAYAVALAHAGPWLAIAALVVVAVARWVTRGHVLLLAFLALYVLSFWFPPQFAFGRYPATFYLLATPMNVVAEVLRWPSPPQANHLMNAASVPVWLFVLRPLVVRRWPDLAVLPAAVMLFLQKEVVYYFTYGTIEPWSLIVLLTAIELMIVAPREHQWAACVLVAVSMLIKETTVLLFPIFWAVTIGFTRGPRRPAIDLRAVAFGAALLAPFVVFYVLRREIALLRTVGISGLEHVFATGRMREFWSLLHFQQGSTGIAILIAIAAYWIAALVAARPRGRHLALHVALGGAAVGLVAFFFGDDMSIPYTAYSRYMLYPLFLGSAILLLAGHRLVAAGRARTAAAIAVAIVACQAVPLARTLALDWRPDYARNSREWNHIPVYLPIRALVDRIPGGTGVWTIRIVTYGFDASGAPNVYRDLSRRYTLAPDQQTPERVDCRCVSADTAVMLGIEYPTLMATLHDEQRDPRVTAANRDCRAQIVATCETTMSALHDTGDEVGVLGYGRRLPLR